jgi:Flp pilus assembly protein CpaB
VITNLVLIGIAVIVLGVALGRWANDYFSFEAYRVPQRWLVAVHDLPKGHTLAKEDIAWRTTQAPSGMPDGAIRHYGEIARFLIGHELGMAVPAGDPISESALPHLPDTYWPPRYREEQREPSGGANSGSAGAKPE